MTNEERINEVKFIYEYMGVLPTIENDMNFSDGTSMGQWIIKNYELLVDNEQDKEIYIDSDGNPWRSEKAYIEYIESCNI